MNFTNLFDVPGCHLRSGTFHSRSSKKRVVAIFA